jgi:hypothetical protein
MSATNVLTCSEAGRLRAYFDPTDFQPSGYPLITVLGALHRDIYFHSPWPEQFTASKSSAPFPLRSFLLDWPTFQHLVERRLLRVSAFPSYCSLLERRRKDYGRDGITISDAYLEEVKRNLIPDRRNGNARKTIKRTLEQGLTHPLVTGIERFIRTEDASLLRRHRRILNGEVLFGRAKKRTKGDTRVPLPEVFEESWTRLSPAQRVKSVIEYDYENDMLGVRRHRIRQRYVAYESVYSMASLGIPAVLSDEQLRSEWFRARQRILELSMRSVSPKALVWQPERIIEEFHSLHRRPLLMLLDNCLASCESKDPKEHSRIVARCVREYEGARELPTLCLWAIPPLFALPSPCLEAWAATVAPALLKKSNLAVRFLRRYSAATRRGASARWWRPPFTRLWKP